MTKLTGLATLLALMLGACGGGGGGSDPSANTPPPGPSAPPTTSTIYNECTDPTAMTLPTGYSRSAVYTMLNDGKVTGEWISADLINGPGTFEGRSAIPIALTDTINTIATATTSATTTTNHTLEYNFIQNNGLVTVLGYEEESVKSGFTHNGVTVPAFTTRTREVYSSYDDTRMLTLKLGESATLAIAGRRMHTMMPSTTTTVAFSYNTTQTYAARETVTVLGRSFDTCKYTITGGEIPLTSHTWLMVGNGTAVRTDIVDQDGHSMQLLLRSGTYNGVPL